MGYPTPKATDGSKGSTSHVDKSTGHDLPTTVGWATPQAHDGATPKTEDQIAIMKAAGHGVANLNEQATLAGWATPVSTEIGNTMASYQAMKANAKSGARTAITHPSLQAQLVMVSGSGPTSSGSPAETQDEGSPIGQLNPGFSCWLMGFSAEWDACAGTATRSSRSARSPSSRQRSPQPKKAKAAKSSEAETKTKQPARSPQIRTEDRDGSRDEANDDGVDES